MFTILKICKATLVKVGSFIKTVNEGKSKIKVYKNHDKDKFVGSAKRFRCQRSLRVTCRSKEK